jgi:hypothetical protein
VKPTKASSSYHPLPFAGRSTDAVIAGGVLSSETEVCAVAEFPALSSAVPSTPWLAASAEITWLAEQLAMPESVSAQMKLTVTSWLFQPFALAAGDFCALIVGGVLSI